LLADPQRSKVALSVYEDNTPALALYARLGFTHAASLVGYLRRPPGKTEHEP
jgi:ribosomal protein S18 acetylase RimI-like enzyme